MKKSILVLMLTVLASLETFSQVDIYDPKADAVLDIENALETAKNLNKNVLIQIGGNWCPWCVKLHRFFESDSTIQKILSQNYVVVMVNYSKENKNMSVLKKLQNPQRFGFPVLVVLDSNGNRIHTQDTGLLESGNGYDYKKVIGFLKNWTPSAIK